MDVSKAYGVSIWLQFMPAEDVIESFLTHLPMDPTARREHFISSGLKKYTQYTENELIHLFYRILPLSAPDGQNSDLFTNIFELAKQALYLDGDTIRCRHSELVDWRESVHEIGQTPFLCAFLAYEDFKRNYTRIRHDWPPYAKTDNLRLRQILSKGMAENHYHLKGSAPPFMLAWLCLTNHVMGRRRQFHELARMFFGKDCPAPQDLLHKQVVQAAIIRFVLNQALSVSSEAELEQWQVTCHNWLRATETNLSLVTGQLQEAIDHQRFLLFPNSLDYLYETTIFPDDSIYKIVGGEHQFQYRVFKAIFSGDWRMVPFRPLFEAYLIIWVRLRSELIQVNDTVGFYNFVRYQDRKEIFLDGYPQYEAALIKMAYLINLENHDIQSFEARISQKATGTRLRDSIRTDCRTLLRCRPNECQDCEFYDEVFSRCRYRFNMQTKEPPCLSKMFYVVHFIKDPFSTPIDPAHSNSAANYSHCRDHRLREKIRQETRGLLNLRSSGAVEGTLIYGLDACNHEIGCRPEVFAPSFRYARLKSPDECSVVRYGLRMPILRITYHVGEDFLDVVDGLRAINEAILFLEMRHGDRLGHAIALGINVSQWYEGKRERLFLPRQDLLDNAVWLSMQLRKYNISSADVEHELKSIFREHFNYVYRSVLPFSHYEHSITAETYYESWRIRGDEPAEYLTLMNEYQSNRSLYLSQGEYQMSDDCKRIREDNKQAIHLLHQYHFNPEVKRRGSEPIEFPVSKKYINAVHKLQAAMRRDISHRGIGIETNPSSNYLISTFRRYDKHPLLTFSPVRQEDRSEPVLSASINTDDQGIFDTDLENEYALMACALECAQDAEGNDLYDSDEIYRWIDRIRERGIEQSFKLMRMKTER